MASTVYELYRSAKVVWVEDELTREVLTILWGSCPLHVAVAGNKNVVAALVAAAPSSVKGRVFGVVDLDFAPPNRDAWDRVEVLRLPVHEAENLLLDPVCLAAVSQANGGKATPAQIEDLIVARATTMVTWMACRATLREIAEHLEFPGDPKPNEVSSLAIAAQYIRTHRAWIDSPREWTRWSAARALDDALTRWERVYQDSLSHGAWRDSFSGKELLRALREERSLRLDATPQRLPRTAAERDLDLARLVARAMVESRQVPAAVSDMRAALLAR